VWASSRPLPGIAQRERSLAVVRADGFTTPPPSCKNEFMKPMMVIQGILRSLVVLAVLMGPVSVNSAAAAMDASGPMAGMAMEIVDEEAMANMPCCPNDDKTSVPDCMKSCPLALLCSTVIVGSLSPASGLPLIHPLPMSFSSVAGEEPASALVDPPPRPPRA